MGSFPAAGPKRPSSSRSTGTHELPDEIIVRKDRPVGLLEHRAADEFAVLQAVYAHGGVPVARPFFGRDWTMRSAGAPCW